MTTTEWRLTCLQCDFEAREVAEGHPRDGPPQAVEHVVARHKYTTDQSHIVRVAGRLERDAELDPSLVTDGGTEIPDACITCGAEPEPHGEDCWECPECGLTGCGMDGCEPRPVPDGGKDLPQPWARAYDAVTHGVRVSPDCLALTGDGHPCVNGATSGPHGQRAICGMHDSANDPDLMTDAHQWVRIVDGDRTVAVCPNCEAVWEGGPPALRVACPTCDAAPGQRCSKPVTASGGHLLPHPERRRVVQDRVAELETCPESPLAEETADDDAQQKLADGGQQNQRIKPGDVVIDRATNSPLYVVSDTYSTAVDHPNVRQDDTGAMFGATDTDRVYECVYLPDDGEVRPQSKTYHYAESRLFRYPVEQPVTDLLVDPPTDRVLDELAETVARDLDEPHRQLFRDLVEQTYGDLAARSLDKSVEAIAEQESAIADPGGEEQ